MTVTDSLCGICLHQDEALEYSHGGTVLDTLCLFGHAHFRRVKKYDQCRDFTNMNQQEALDADIDFLEHPDRPDGDRDGGADASAAY